MRTGRTFLLLIIALFICSCVPAKFQTDTTGEYKRVMDLQRQREGLARSQEKPANLPDMTTSDYERVGDNYLHQGNSVMAFIQYRKSLELNPDQPLLKYKTGCLFLEKGLFSEARKEFEDILKKDKENANAYEGMGRVCFAKGDLEGAAENFNRAVKIDPGLWRARALLGIVYDKKKDFAAALREYESALKLYPESAVVYNNMGMSLYLSGKYELSSRAFISAIKLQPENRKLYNNLGLSLCKLGRHREAVEAFKRGADSASAQNNIGYCYIAEKNYGKALDAFSRAIEIRPNFYARAFENLKVTREIMQAK